MKMATKFTYNEIDAIYDYAFQRNGVNNFKLDM